MSLDPAYEQDGGRFCDQYKVVATLFVRHNKAGAVISGIQRGRKRHLLLARREDPENLSLFDAELEDPLDKCSDCMLVVFLPPMSGRVDWQAVANILRLFQAQRLTEWPSYCGQYWKTPAGMKQAWDYGVNLTDAPSMKNVDLSARNEKNKRAQTGQQPAGFQDAAVSMSDDDDPHMQRALLATAVQGKLHAEQQVKSLVQQMKLMQVREKRALADLKGLKTKITEKPKDEVTSAARMASALDKSKDEARDRIEFEAEQYKGKKITKQEPKDEVTFEARIANVLDQSKDERRRRIELEAERYKQVELELLEKTLGASSARALKTPYESENKEDSTPPPKDLSATPSKKGGKKKRRAPSLVRAYARGSNHLSGPAQDYWCRLLDMSTPHIAQVEKNLLFKLQLVGNILAQRKQAKARARLNKRGARQDNPEATCGRSDDDMFSFSQHSGRSKKEQRRAPSHLQTADPYHCGRNSRRGPSKKQEPSCEMSTCGRSEGEEDEEEETIQVEPRGRIPGVEDHPHARATDVGEDEDEDEDAPATDEPKDEEEPASDDMSLVGEAEDEGNTFEMVNPALYGETAQGSETGDDEGESS